MLKQVASARTVFVLGLWDKHHIALHVTSGFVVLAMRNLPGEIWYQKGGVTEEADSVVENFAGGKGLMTTLVSQHPETRTEKALHKGVQKPETSS